MRARKSSGRPPHPNHFRHPRHAGGKRSTVWTAVAAIAACLCAGPSGCATVGHEFPVAAVDEIVIGQTTQSDIQRMFGNPWRIGVEDGDTTWTYGHYRYKLFGRAKTRDLVLRFDARGVVSSYTFNTTEHEDRATGSP